jgi:hypothetical protein
MHILLLPPIHAIKKSKTKNHISTVFYLLINGYPQHNSMNRKRTNHQSQQARIAKGRRTISHQLSINTHITSYMGIKPQTEIVSKVF